MSTVKPRVRSPQKTAGLLLGLGVCIVWGSYCLVQGLNCAAQLASPQTDQQQRSDPEQSTEPTIAPETKIESAGDTEVTTSSTQQTSSEQHSTIGLSGEDITRMQYVGLVVAVVLGLGLVAVALLAVWSFFKSVMAQREAICAYTKGRAARKALEHEQHARQERA